MCVAIVCKEGAVLTEQQIENGWLGNPDGGGFAYVSDNEVHIVKGFMTLEDLQRAYKTYADLHSADSPFLVHMRIGTSGGNTPLNTHPFKILNGAMIHNGVMFTPAGQRAGKPGDYKSDTRVFAEALYSVLQLEHVKRAEARILREVGYSNKLAFLYNDKRTLILNEDGGYWENNIWFSNSSCRVSRSYRRYNGVNGGNSISSSEAK